MSFANLLKETRVATSDAVGPLRRSIAQYAREVGLDEDRIAVVVTAFSEAVANVVAHAYPDRPGEVQVSAFVAKDELWIKVADEGIGCNERSARSGQGLGLGLGLMADACDRFEIEARRSGGTLVTMRFRLDPDGQPA